MNKVKFTVLAIVAAFATTASATDIEFHGYTRAGLALNSNGGTGVCYRLAGADSDFRLGNECDYVVEPNFEVVMAKLDDKSTWGYHIMPSVYKNWPIDQQPRDDKLVARFGQVYFFGNNIPWLANGSLWAGRKFWDRLQLGINDQFIENEDSDSFGVENMDLGFGKLSVGFGLASGSDSTGAISAASRTYKVAARLTGIQTMNKDSSLQIWTGLYGTYSNEDIAGEAPDMGWRIGAYHNFGFGSAGNLFVGVKYDKNSDASNYDGKGNGRTALRGFAQYGVAIPAVRASLDILATVRHADFENDQGPGAPGPNGEPPRVPGGETYDAQLWTSVGARWDMQIGGPFRFLVEAGWDMVDKSPWTGESESLIKVTPAIAISAGNDPWSRPTFRFYYTYATWSDVDVLDAGWHSASTQSVFEDEKAGGTFGVQAEGWW